MRTDLRLRSLNVCIRAILFGAVLLPVALCGADAPVPVADTPPVEAPQLQAPTAQAPAPAAQPAAQAPSGPQRPPVLAKGKKPDVPDYPDPRTITFGAYYFGTVPGNGPDVQAGKITRDFGTIRGLGKEHMGPGVFASVPVSRTTEIRFEGFETKGAGNQKLTGKDPAVFGTQFNAGDYLSNSYRVVSGKLWVDDLFWPHKFPVAKFRVKAIYGARYLVVKGVIDAPLKLPSGATFAGVTALGNKQVVLPAIGLAPEFAISKHLLFRVEGSGFTLPHRSALWDGEATLSYRRQTLEVFGGFKAVGFKTSPKQDFFYSGQVYGGVVGLKYHWQ